MKLTSNIGALRLRAMASCAGLAMLCASLAAHAQCSPNPPQSGTTTVCTGTEPNGVVSTIPNPTITVVAGASVLSPGGGTSAIAGASSSWTVDNAGTIDGGAASALSSAAGAPNSQATLNNSSGGILRNDSASATVVSGEVFNAFSNAGVISNSGSGLAISSANGVTLVNTGAISGGLAVGAASATTSSTIVNTGGVINGSITFGSASASVVNTVDNTGGVINGGIAFGAGKADLIADFGTTANPIKNISGPVTAGGTNNTLQLDFTKNTILSAPITLPSGFQTLVYGIGGGATLFFAAGDNQTSTVNLAASTGSGSFVNNAKITTVGPAIAANSQNFTDIPVSLTNNGTIAATLSGGYAITLGAYGLGGLTNTGTITATGGGAVNANSGNSPVTNSGTITATGTGVYEFDAGFSNSGVVHSDGGTGVELAGNQGSPASNTGTIYGQTIGAEISGFTLTNSGTISSPGLAISLDSGSALINAADGHPDVALYGPAGVINGSVGFGAFLFGPFPLATNNSLINESGGVINGTVTIASGSVTNAGLINGGSGPSIVFQGAFPNTLTLQTGSQLIGDAQGSTADGAANALILQGTGTASNIFLNFNTLDVQAAGTWTLGGTSTIGTTTVSSGTLVVTGALTSAFTINPGATLQGSSSTLLAQGTVANSGTLVFDQAADGTFASGIVGAGAIVKQNTGALTLSGTSSAGSTTVAAGSLIVTGALTGAFTINPGATLQGSSSSLLAQGAVTNNGTLVFDQAATGTFANAITGTGALIKQNGGALTLSGVSSVATTTVTGGTLIVTGALTSAFTTQAGGVLQGSTSTLLAQGAVTDNGTLVFDQASDGTFANAISGAASGALVKQNTGTLTLSGAAQVETTTVTGGSLVVTGSLNSSVMTIRSGATLQGSSSTLMTSSAVNDAGALVFNQAADGTFSSDIQGGGALVKQGIGVLTLSGAVGVSEVMVAAGELVAPQGISGAAATIDAGATLQVNTFGAGVGTFYGSVTDNGTLVLNDLSSNDTIGGPAGRNPQNTAAFITGTGSLIKLGDGVLELGGASSVASTTVTSGELVVLGPLSSAFTIDAGAVLIGTTSTLFAQGTVTDYGTLYFQQNANGTFGNAVVGTGALVLGGSGTLTLSGVSNVASTEVSGGGDIVVTGAVTSAFKIDGGSTLQGSTATLLAQGTVTDNGTLVFDQATNGTFANAISGTGAIVKQNAGALTLSGVSSVGSTTVTGGTLVVTGTLTSALAIQSGGTLQGSTSTLLAQGTVTDNGTLVFDQATAGTFANAITGSGAIVKQNSGTLTLEGASTVGTTTVASGTLVVTGGLTSAFAINAGATLQGSTATLLAQGAVADDGTLVFDQAAGGAFVNAITGSGAIVKLSAGTLTLSGASTVGTTTVAGGTLVAAAALSSAFTIGAGATLQGSSSTLLAQGTVADNGTLVFDQAVDGAFSNAILGSGALIKQNVGTLVLNGVSSVATTQVNGGVLEIGDAATPGAQLTSAVTVSAGGTLAGHGTIVGSVTNNGVVAPGGSIGTLTVKGNYTQGPNGVLSIMTAGTQSSTLNVTGTATLAGSLQLTVAQSVFRKGTSFDVLNATTVIGGFSSAATSSGVPLTVQIENGEVLGVVTQGVVQLAPGATPNQAAIAAGFVNYPVGVSDFDPVANAIIGMPQGPAQNAAFDSLGGEVYADLKIAGRDSARAFLGQLSDQLSSERTGGDPIALWGQATGAFGSVDAGGGAHGVSSNAGGMVFGLDRRFGASDVVGASLSYDHTHLSLKGLSQSGDVDDKALAVYGEHRLGVWFADAAFAYDLQDGKGERAIDLPGVARSAHADVHGYILSGALEAGARLQAGGLRWEPSVSLVANGLHQDGLTESGAGGADLAVQARRFDALESVAGVRVSRSFAVAGGVLALDGRLAWAHELREQAPGAAMSFAAAPGAGFALEGARPGADNAVLGVGLTYRRGQNLSIALRYDGVAGGQETRNAVTLGARLAW